MADNKKSEQSFEEVLKTLTLLKTQLTGLVNQTKTLNKSVNKKVKRSSKKQNERQ